MAILLRMGAGAPPSLVWLRSLVALPLADMATWVGPIQQQSPRFLTAADICKGSTHMIPPERSQRCAGQWIVDFTVNNPAIRPFLAAAFMVAAQRAGLGHAQSETGHLGLIAVVEVNDDGGNPKHKIAACLNEALVAVGLLSAREPVTPPLVYTHSAAERPASGESHRHQAGREALSQFATAGSP